MEQEGKAASNTSRAPAVKSQGKSDTKVERSDTKAEDGEEGGPKKRKANSFTKQIMCVLRL